LCTRVLPRFALVSKFIFNWIIDMRLQSDLILDLRLNTRDISNFAGL